MVWWNKRGWRLVIYGLSDERILRFKLSDVGVDIWICYQGRQEGVFFRRFGCELEVLVT